MMSEARALRTALRVARMAGDAPAIQVVQRKMRERANARRRERDQARRDLGLVRVRGSLGGTYWE